jgi:outer membrane biosynthesis protein TonB
MKWLIIFLLTLTIVQAEEITTGNLLPNAGDGVDWNSSSTDQINPGSSGYVSNNDTMNGFTVTCPTSQSNCGYKHNVGGDFEVTGTATITKNDIALTNTNRTQDMLDNGITLNNYIDIANCDHEAGNCEGDTGNTDSHTITIQLKDPSGTVLSTTTQTRTDIDGFKGNCNGYPTSSSAGVSANCGQYNDKVIYNNTGSNKVDWSWSGTDNNTGTASRGGPNLLGAKLTMTYDNTVLDTETSTALDNVEEALEDLQEEVFDDMEEFYFEEEYFTFDEEPQFEMETEMETFTFAEEFVEEFFDEMFMEDSFFMDMEDEGMSFEEGPMIVFADEEMMEEIYEESNEIVATFLPMVSEEEEFSYEESFVEDDGPIFMEPTEDGEGFTTETFQEEELIEEEPSMMTETFQEEEMIEEEPAMVETFQEEEEMMEEEMPEESTEMAEEEVMEEENTEMAEEEAVEEEPTQMVQATNEEEKEEVKEEKSDSESPKKSAVQTKKLAKQKKIQQKKAIVKNLARIMDKVDKDIKDISKNLAVKNIIKMEAMTGEQASLNAYANTAFYAPKNIYLDQLNIFDNRQIYPNTNLASYIQNDKIDIKAKKLNEINIKKQQLLIELEALKNG